MYYAIFNRKKYIDDIHEYQILHKGKLRKLPCITRIKNFFKHLPHPDKYDYDCFNSEILFGNILLFCMKRYKPNFNLHAEPFPGRLLRIFCPYEEFNKVDQFFLAYRSKGYGKKDEFSHSSMKLSCSNLNLIDVNNNKAENSPKIPILKTHGRYSQVRDTKLSINETHFKFSHDFNVNSVDGNGNSLLRLRAKTQSSLDFNLNSPARITKLSAQSNKSFTCLFDTTSTKLPTAI